MKKELINFANATQKMNFGDSFKIGKTGGETLTMVHHEDDNDMKAFKSDLHEEYVIVEPELLRAKGQIIPEEKKVLNYDEWRKTKDNRFLSHECFEAGEENQWVNHKELREAAISALKSVQNWEDYTFLRAIHEAIKNLKPLKAE